MAIRSVQSGIGRVRSPGRPIGSTSGGGGGGAVTCRYIRLVITASQGATNWKVITEVTPVLGGVEYTWNGGIAAVATSQLNITYNALKAFNNSLLIACWTSAGTVTQFVSQTLSADSSPGALISMDSVKITNDNATAIGSVNTSPRDFTIEISDDNTNWTVVKTVTNESWSGLSETKTYTL